MDFIQLGIQRWIHLIGIGIVFWGSRLVFIVKTFGLHTIRTSAMDSQDSSVPVSTAAGRTFPAHAQDEQDDMSLDKLPQFMELDNFAAKLARLSNASFK